MSRLTSNHSSSISLANSRAAAGGKEATVFTGCRPSHAPSDTDSRPSRIRVKLHGLRQTGPLRKGKEPLANERAALANFGPATFVRSSVWTLYLAYGRCEKNASCLQRFLNGQWTEAVPGRRRPKIEVVAQPEKEKT